MAGLDLESFNKYFCGGPYQQSILISSSVTRNRGCPSVARLSHTLFLPDVSPKDKETYRLPESGFQTQLRAYSRSVQGIEIIMVSKTRQEEICVSGTQLIARPEVTEAIFDAIVDLEQESLGQDLIERVIDHWASKKVRTHD